MNANPEGIPTNFGILRISNINRETLLYVSGNSLCCLGHGDLHPRRNMRDRDGRSSILVAQASLGPVAHYRMAMALHLIDGNDMLRDVPGKPADIVAERSSDAAKIRLTFN